jgi:hypothetical protein
MTERHVDAPKTQGDAPKPGTPGSATGTGKPASPAPAPAPGAQPAK